MAEEFQSRDVIRIEILGQQAVEILQQLSAFGQRLRRAFSSSGHLLMPSYLRSLVVVGYVPCLAASKSIILAATAAFNDSALPGMGI